MLLSFSAGFTVFCWFITGSSEISSLSLHDALPISRGHRRRRGHRCAGRAHRRDRHHVAVDGEREEGRSEEHTSELQSRGHLVCRLLREKKKSFFACCTGNGRFINCL